MTDPSRCNTGCMQDTNAQLSSDLSESQKELEQLRAEAAKKAKKKAKNSRSIGAQCELSHGDEVAAMPSSGGLQMQAMRSPAMEAEMPSTAVNHSVGSVKATVLRHMPAQVQRCILCPHGSCAAQAGCLQRHPRSCAGTGAPGGR
jgi:hypothetical protein